jgi:hypothetical protein
MINQSYKFVVASLFQSLATHLGVMQNMIAGKMEFTEESGLHEVLQVMKYYITCEVFKDHVQLTSITEKEFSDHNPVEKLLSDGKKVYDEFHAQFKEKSPEKYEEFIADARKAHEIALNLYDTLSVKS